MAAKYNKLGEALLRLGAGDEKGNLVPKKVEAVLTRISERGEIDGYRLVRTCQDGKPMFQLVRVQ